MSKSDEQIDRESNRKIAKDAAKAFPPAPRKSGGVADWQHASPESVVRLVCLVGLVGGAVRYGYTRDGGAYSIGIYLGSDSKTFYCNESEGINDTLAELIGYFER